MRCRIVQLPLLLLLLVEPSSRAAAQLPPELVLRGEAAASVSLPDYQRDSLDQIVGAFLAVRVGYRVFDPLTFQVGYDTYLMPSAFGLAQQHGFTGGVRLEPRVSFGRLFIDVNAGAGLTGGRVRFGLDAGAGIEFEIAEWLRLGPFVRYGHLFAADQDYPSDAQFVSAGVSLALGAPEHRAQREAAPARADTDGDGVTDEADVCPEEAATDTPDPQRAGCPLADRDGDGVPDRDDLCPEIAAGGSPSAQRPGCPLEDADADGVSDADDACPTVARGEHPDPARAGCPEADTDGDGLLDSADTCPTESPGLIPDPARPGCRLPDDDGDSVPDAADACRGQPGAPHTDPRRNGCPGLSEILGGQIRIMRPIFFGSNSERILPRSLPVLRAIAEVMRATPQIRRLAIEGHTDELGDAEYNLELSQRRAHSVMGWLVQHGVEASRLSAEGFGESRPLVPSTTPEALAANRRVQFLIVDPPIQGAEAQP